MIIKEFLLSILVSLMGGQNFIYVRILIPLYNLHTIFFIFLILFNMESIVSSQILWIIKLQNILTKNLRELAQNGAIICTYCANVPVVSNLMFTPLFEHFLVELAIFITFYQFLPSILVNRSSCLYHLFSLRQKVIIVYFLH